MITLPCIAYINFRAPDITEKYVINTVLNVNKFNSVHEFLTHFQYVMQLCKYESSGERPGWLECYIEFHNN